MIVCSCNVLSDHDIRTAASKGATVRTVGDVYRTLGGCDGQCHRCARSIKAVLDEVRSGDCDACPTVCGAHVTDTGHVQRQPLHLHGVKDDRVSPRRFGPAPLLEAAE
ncbi:(2Fe-2S)-binding protein [Blastochloris sulfoviridis]|uniref:BFD-like [2Fe-2S]-binding domain-containing protein n=1 Tax=Blastochloris sulfoviridis TaxID=50712 RepID=A0A5M6HUK6_9HYPH|nr:(2Fe-2S)-binding protein [Blastochloris sulfoviridis]KAA5599239.1 hypothetical protein F1193_12475 [Blastochloris sulfoviridis]